MADKGKGESSYDKCFIDKGILFEQSWYNECKLRLC